MNRILIGGENAGKIIETNRDYIRVPISDYSRMPPGPVERLQEFLVEEYIERIFRTQNKEWRILGLASMSDAELFEELLRNYRPYKGGLLMNIDEQIKQKQQQIDELAILQEGHKETLTVWWFYAGKIALLFEQIDELRRAEDKRIPKNLHTRMPNQRCDYYEEEKET